MKYLPIGLNVSGKKILVVGAGKVALQKIKILKNFDCRVTIVAPSVYNQVQIIADEVIIGAYQARFLNNIDLVYACTNNFVINKKIAKDARKRKILVNVADNSVLSDFISPALYIDEPMIIAISSDARAPKASKNMRDKLKQVLRDDKVSRDK
ncbi:porphyrin biosynthesis protein [Candidatus Omnitrophus magneticus]|uniref:precorrin-2 dehydrogenase n=1 Tax=Candidatus Omnitrophus magneticus TaxID=1609969 RepID=A0A0F0CLV9_9BACT|nr:porphyrin biosynthesis protein [Candidatus Omnitrophus magneticus]